MELCLLFLDNLQSSSPAVRQHTAVPRYQNPDRSLCLFKSSPIQSDPSPSSLPAHLRLQLMSRILTFITTLSTSATNIIVTTIAHMAVAVLLPSFNGIAALIAAEVAIPPEILVTRLHVFDHVVGSVFAAFPRGVTGFADVVFSVRFVVQVGICWRRIALADVACPKVMSRDSFVTAATVLICLESVWQVLEVQTCEAAVVAAGAHDVFAPFAR